MQIVTVEQLAKGGISIGQSSTITIKNRQFHIGPTFSLKMRDAAISFCKQEESQGIKCLLVENATALTVWKHTVDLTEKIDAELNYQEFVERCRQELTKCIGPMATLIVDELVSGNKPLKASQLIEKIVAEIPDPKFAAEFRSKFPD